MGKKWGRTFFFPFPFLHFLAPFFPLFGQNDEKRVKKEAEGQKNGWKDVERRRTAGLHLSKFSNLARFRFLYHLKPVFSSFQTRSWPFLYYSSIISRYVPLAA